MLRVAAPLAARARTGYKIGEEQRRQSEAAQARADRAEKRQSLLDTLKLPIEMEKEKATIDRLHADTERLKRDDVIYKVDADGNLVALPKKLPSSPSSSSSGSSDASKSGGQSTGQTSGQTSAPSAAPSLLSRMKEPTIDENRGGRANDAEAGAAAAEASLASPTSSTPILDGMRGGASASTSPTQPTIGTNTGVRAASTKRITRPNVVEPDGVYDIYNDGTRTRRRDLTPVEKEKIDAKPAPKLTRSGGGYVQWDAESGKWKSSGVAGPASTSASDSPVHRENEIRKRAFTLMKPRKGQFGKEIAGLDQDAAMTRAAAEYDAASRAAGSAPATPAGTKKPAGADQQPGNINLDVGGPKLSEHETSVVDRAIAKIKTPADYQAAKKQLGAFSGVWAAIESRVPAGIRGAKP